MKKYMLLMVLGACGSSECFADVIVSLMPEIAFNFKACYSYRFPGCDSSHQIVGKCDNRNPGPTYSTKGQSPWKSVGYLESGCTGTLISPNHVLTAAHCVINPSHLLSSDKLGFNLGQYVAAGTSTKMSPYGKHYAKRVFVPKSYVTNSGGSEAVKIYDYAVVELKNALPSENVWPLPIAQIDWIKLWWGSEPYYSIGYPYDKAPAGSIWGTAGYYKAMKYYSEGSIIKTNIDGAGGQSGSPVYRFIDNKRTLIGVLIGSPTSVCENEGVTWTVFMTQWALDNVVWPSVYYNWFPFLDKNKVAIFNYPSVPQDTPPTSLPWAPVSVVQ